MKCAASVVINIFPCVARGKRRAEVRLAGTGYFALSPRYRLFSCVKPLAGCGVATVCRGRLTAGAEHTIHSGQPLSRESGFFVSTCASKPGSVLAIQDPPGEGGRPDCVQVFKYPALTCSEQASQRPRTKLHSFLGDAMRRCYSYLLLFLCVFRFARGSRLLAGTGFFALSPRYRLFSCVKPPSKGVVFIG